MATMSTECVARRFINSAAQCRRPLLLNYRKGKVCCEASEEAGEEPVPAGEWGSGERVALTGLRVLLAKRSGYDSRAGPRWVVVGWSSEWAASSVCLLVASGEEERDSQPGYLARADWARDVRWTRVRVDATPEEESFNGGRVRVGACDSPLTRFLTSLWWKNRWRVKTRALGKTAAWGFASVFGPLWQDPTLTGSIHHVEAWTSENLIELQLNYTRPLLQKNITNLLIDILFAT